MKRHRLLIERKLYSSLWAIAVLADQHFSAIGIVTIFFVLALAVEHQNVIRVLFDRTGISEVGSLRTFIMSLFTVSRELGESNHRTAKVTSQLFEVLGK